MKFGVLVFPGSNCDHDTFHVVSAIAHQPVTFLWHETEDLEGCDAILVPGGFAYGDYLRTGAIAHFAPVMQAVKKFAARDGLVLGICNGFQILCESGLLPGALMRNAGLKYICKQLHVRTETSDCPLPTRLRTSGTANPGRPHGRKLLLRPADTRCARTDRRIAFRYSTPEGAITPEANPNGSLENIAGILSEGRNVLGLMPHPDRSSEAAARLLGRAADLPIHGRLLAPSRLSRR